MRVSDPLNESIINCTKIEMYTQSAFLHVTMITQGLFGILSLLSMALTLRKILQTAMIDRAFKEYILTSYVVQIITGGALAVLQIILLYTFWVAPPCGAYIFAPICYILRMITSASSILPLLNVALTLFRFCALRSADYSLKKSVCMHRIFQLIATLSGVAFYVYKFSDVRMDGYVVYCIANKKGDSFSRTLQNIWGSLCEVFSIGCGLVLFRSYKNSDRTFNVNSSLTRRQAIQTFYLFLSYTLIQGVAFCAYGVLSVVSRSVFGGIPEPTYSAGSGLLFIPMYFSTFSPWLIYYIIRREEKKRVKETNDLLTQEQNCTDMHFLRLREQWNAPRGGQTTENDQKVGKPRTKCVDQWFGHFSGKKTRICPVSKYT